MDERVIKRGEVYWVSVDDSVGSEIQTGRPALIVSSTGLNNQLETVTVAFMTTSSQTGQSYRVKVRCDGRESVVRCDQVRTIDKTRLTKFIGTLTSEEMLRVGGSLASGFSLTPPAKETTNVVDNTEVQKLKVELDIAKGMYQEVLRQLIELRVSADIGVNDEVESIEEEPIDTKENVEPARFLVEPERTADINTATETELRGVGCTPEMSRRIIENRPYDAVEDLKKYGWMTRMGYQLVKGRLTCTPVITEEPIVEGSEAEQTVVVRPQGKININTAGGKELSDFLGCPTFYAYAITGYRNRNGNLVSLEELRDIKKIPKDFLEKYGEFLTLGEEESEVTEVTEVEEEPAQRLNINVATMREFMGVGFGKREAALIVSERKKFGNFRSVEDLSEIPGVTGKILRKLKDVLYVESSGVKPYCVG